MMRVFLLPSLFLLLIGALAFYARSGGGNGGRELVVANAAEILSRDVTKMTYAQDIRMAMGLYEGLLIYNPAKMSDPDARTHFLPGVAESWETSNGGNTYTFHLRKNAKWSNGDPVVAGDFLFAWKRALTPASGCEYAGLYNNIKGAKAYFEAQDPARKLPAVGWDTVGVRAPDDFTIQVELSGACGYFLDLMAFPTFFPLHAKSMEAFKAGEDYQAEYTRPGMVSNGAYFLKDFRQGDYTLLARNPFYWDAAHVRQPLVKLVTQTDPASSLVALGNKSVDVLTSVPMEFAPELLREQEQGQRNDVHLQPVFGTYYYVFNCKRAPLNDARVRMALALVVDKGFIVEEVTRLKQRPINTITPPGSISGYDAPHGLDRDVERARKLLAEAGFPEGKGMRPIELLYNTEGTHSRVAQAVGQMWQRELHIPVTFKGVDLKTYRGLRALDHDFDVSRAGWYGDYPDPMTWLDLFRSTDGNNDGQFASAKYDGLLDQAARETDVGRRFAILREAESLLTDQEMPFLPLYQYTDGYMYDPKKVGGMDMNVRMLTEMKFLRFLGGNTP